MIDHDDYKHKIDFIYKNPLPIWNALPMIDLNHSFKTKLKA